MIQSLPSGSRHYVSNHLTTDSQSDRGTGQGGALRRQPGRSDVPRAAPLALNSGRPREIIADGETGFLYQSIDDLKTLTIEILAESGRPNATRIRPGSTRARDFSVENFERSFETLSTK
jgi:hypothetical protein